ncbi:lipase domain-containing protein, putative [Eimeria tenella]|uniref:Lipase domain-containing protein, putative n=1 Tax=Eimeria tenella TaxID=5802 RepID=U6KQT9_EIMTE|nr:lipase domain-containing protein, putative [Eimeria tenella]CDJ40447.1 lipase domain-containing protein, putative [Eimeria tenella]|eukprot:XP_013231197.1 lipase domain-containing protein, putative [Eimeria tenella]
MTGFGAKRRSWRGIQKYQDTCSSSETRMHEPACPIRHRMLPPGASADCRVLRRSLAYHRSRLSSAILCLLALLPCGFPQEHNEPLNDAGIELAIPPAAAVTPATPAQPPLLSHAANAEKEDDRMAVPTAPPSTADNEGQTSAPSSVEAADKTLTSDSVSSQSSDSPPAASAPAPAPPDARHYESASLFSPMTVTIVIGAGETVRDCTEELPSQSFLMGVARRFQQLQLLPLLVAFGQQSLRVVTNNTRFGNQMMPSSPRLLQPDSLLLSREASPRERHQQTMLVEVASRTPMLPQFVWENGSGLRTRNAAMQANFTLWPKNSTGIQENIHRSLLGQTASQLLSQSRLMRGAGSQRQPVFVPRRVQQGVLEGLQHQVNSNELQWTAPQLQGSFLGNVLQALEGAPIRVNLGDMACAALPTSALNRKLSCWLLGAFTERILCRTAWFDPCQAISDETAHGKPPLSPVVLPPGGTETLALPLRNLLHARRGIPKKTPKDVISLEGPTYQLLWQALTRLDDIWALAYCGRDLQSQNPAGTNNTMQSRTNKDRRRLQGEAQEQQKQGDKNEENEGKSNQETDNKQEQSPQVPQLFESASLPGIRGTPALSLWTLGPTTKPTTRAALSSGESESTKQPEEEPARLFTSPLWTLQNLTPEPSSGGTAGQGSDVPPTNPLARVPTPVGSEKISARARSSTRELPEGVPHLQGQDLLPGWRTELILKALSPGVGNRTNVLAVAGRRGTEVLIAFRGTKTQVEWILNGQAEHAFNWLGDGEGRTAAGFSHIFSAAWPALQVYLASVDKPEAPLSRILVTGYSLGGAVAALMAYGIALNYPTKVDAVIFGAPRTGDSAFMAAWAKRVNGRNVAFTYDPIPRTPCTEMPACDKPGSRGPLTLPKNFLRFANHSPRMNGASGRAEIPAITNGYGDFYGLVSFGPDELGGSSRSRVSPMYVSYNHICAYPCWLATKFNPGERRTLCEMPEFSNQWNPALSPDTCPALLS